MDHLIKAKKINFLKRFRFGIKRRLPWPHCCFQTKPQRMKVCETQYWGHISL